MSEKILLFSLVEMKKGCDLKEMGRETQNRKEIMRQILRWIQWKVISLS